MIYETLKSLVEGLKNSYKCPECSSGVNESDIDIVGAAGNTVNFDVICPKCGKHSMVKSQIMMIDLNGLTQIKHQAEGIKDKIEKNEGKTKKITDNEIVSLDKDLKNKQVNVKDLFK